MIEASQERRMNMSKVECFNESNFEQVSRTLAETVTGTQLGNIFSICQIDDTIGATGTKWKRIYHSMLERQRIDKCGNHVAQFIMAVMSPGRFAKEKNKFIEARRELNLFLSFDGLELDEEGKLHHVEKSRTISEAEKRCQILSAKLVGRDIHPEVIKFCKVELLHDNYFHAVFEATKSLAQRLRDLSGEETDGSRLVDAVFGLDKPTLAINKLTSETEKMEHKGFATLLKGCFMAIRNPLAHEPKILWNGEDDAADYLTLISLLHRKLDSAVRIPRY